MGERVTEQELTVKTKVRDYVCDVCGEVIYTYKDTDILDGRRFERPYEYREVITTPFDDYIFHSMMCQGCRMKKTREIGEALDPVLRGLGFIRDRG